jgi:hypothetical protein
MSQGFHGAASVMERNEGILKLPTSYDASFTAKTRLKKKKGQHI